MKNPTKIAKIIAITVAIVCSLLFAVRMRQESYQFKDVPGLIWGADLTLYFSTLNKVYQHQIPGIDFFVEYPPLAPLGWLTLPLLAKAHSEYDFIRFLYYQNAFVAWILLTFSGYVLLKKNPNSVSNIVAILSLASGLWIVRYLIVARFDILPATLLTIVLLGYQYSDKIKMGAGQLILYWLSVAIKIYPIVMAPAIFRGYTSLSQAKKLIWTALLILAIHIPFFLLGFKNILEFLNYHSARNIEIGSTWAYIGLNMNFSGSEIHNNFGSCNFDGQAYKILGKLAMPLILVLTAAFWYGVIRKIQDLKENLGLVAMVLLSIFIVLGKVWSPQYMLWFVALFPLIRCRLWIQIAVSACILTASWCAYTVAFTNFPNSTVDKDPYVMGLFLMKILCVVTCAGLCLFELMKRREHREILPAVLSPEYA